MEKSLELLIIIALIIALVFVSITAYIMLAGVDGGCSKAIGELKQFYIYPDGKEVKFRIELEYPASVSYRDHVYISVTSQGNTTLLRYNSSANSWEGGDYSAIIYDENRDDHVNSGDYLILHSLAAGFKNGDIVKITISRYSGEISASVHIS